MNVQLPDGETLHVHDSGSGVPVLFVHGFPLDHTIWRRQIDALKSTCRVLAPDLRGFGRSGGAGAEVLSMEQFADDLNALLDAMVLNEPVVFCGLSMGGYVAFRFAERHHRRLRGLILCDTRPGADSEEAATNRMQLAAKVLRSGAKQAVAAMLPKLVAEQTNRNRPEVVDELRETILNTDRRSIAAALRGMAQRPDSTPLLSRIPVPTLAVCGSDDALTPPDAMRAMAAEIPHAQYVEIADAGHMTPMEAPNPVNAAIREFVQSLA